jgi:hypothetical protein
MEEHRAHHDHPGGIRLDADLTALERLEEGEDGVRRHGRAAGAAAARLLRRGGQGSPRLQVAHGKRLVDRSGGRITGQGLAQWRGVCRVGHVLQGHGVTGATGRVRRSGLNVTEWTWVGGWSREWGERSTAGFAAGRFAWPVLTPPSFHLSYLTNRRSNLAKPSPAEVSCPMASVRIGGEMLDQYGRDARAPAADGPAAAGCHPRGSVRDCGVTERWRSRDLSSGESSTRGGKSWHLQVCQRDPGGTWRPGDATADLAKCAQPPSRRPPPIPNW